MSITSTLRVVGLYCQISNKTFETLNPDSNVKDILQAFEDLNLDFSFDGEVLMDTMRYTFSDRSEHPPNATRPTPGFREEGSVIDKVTATIWQYYRSVKAVSTADGNIYEFKIPTKGQPAFSGQPFNGLPDGSSFALPAGFENPVYVLTWRLVKIELKGVSRRKYLEEQMRTQEKVEALA